MTKPVTKRRRLKPQQRLFCREYVRDWNGTAAAKRAGYSEASAAKRASLLLQWPEILDEIEKHYPKHEMGDDETTGRLSQWGRASMGLFLNDKGRLDLTTEIAQANLHLIKKVKKSPKTGEIIELELHDPKDATVQVAKLKGQFKERIEHDGKVLIMRSIGEFEEEEQGNAA